MVDRPDWGPGGESRLPVPTNGTAVPSTTAGLPATDADYSGLGPQAQSTLQTGTGLNHELVREMHGTADGFEANLESLRQSADLLLDDAAGNIRDGRETFISLFDGLSPSIQTKALRAAWQNPGASFLDILDIFEPQLTLSEAYEAEKCVRAWKLWRDCP